MIPSYLFDFALTACDVYNIIKFSSLTKIEIQLSSQIKIEIEVTSTKALYLGSSLEVMWMDSA